MKNLKKMGGSSSECGPGAVLSDRYVIFLVLIALSGLATTTAGCGWFFVEFNLEARCYKRRSMIGKLFSSDRSACPGASTHRDGAARRSRSSDGSFAKSGARLRSERGGGPREVRRSRLVPLLEWS